MVPLRSGTLKSFCRKVYLNVKGGEKGEKREKCEKMFLRLSVFRTFRIEKCS